MAKASIAIFKKKIEYSDDIDVPDEIFAAANRVIESEGQEIVKSKSGFYIVQYSPNGPFTEKIGDDWLPVYVARVEQWRSGGIMKKEMEDATDAGVSSADTGNSSRDER